MPKVALLFCLCEIAYIAAVRVFLANYHGDPVAVELGWTALRLVSVIILLGLLRHSGGSFGAVRKSDWSAVLAGALFLLAPVLVAADRLGSPLNHVYAATSLVVGLREELAYRGLLQRLLADRFGFWPALLGATLCFTLYHIGVQPPDAYSFFQIAAAGLVLGLTYHLTKSIVAVAVLHALYDIVYAYSPVLTPPLPEICGVLVFGVALLALLRLNRIRSARGST